MTRALGSNPPPGIVVGLKQQPLGVLTSGVRLGGGGGCCLVWGIFGLGFGFVLFWGVVLLWFLDMHPC